MMSMSKLEMIGYLKDYANLQYDMMLFPDKDSFEMFCKRERVNINLDDVSNFDYYIRMHRVYLIYLFMKKFSFTEDFLLNRDNYINNDDLDEIIPEKTYDTDMSKISNKDLLKIIRNAFNHNINNSNFKISVNGRKIEITSMNNEKLKFDINDIMIIFINMVKHEKNNLNFYFEIPDDFDVNSDNLFNELDKIKFVHYYFNQRLDESVINKFIELSKTKGLLDDEIMKKSEEFIKISSSINLPVKYDLTNEQKYKIISYINWFKRDYPEFLKCNINNVMYYFLIRVIPVPLLKNKLLDNQILYNELFISYDNIGLRDVIEEINNMLNDKFEKSDSGILDIINSRKKSDNLGFVKDLLNGDMIVGFPIIIYIDAVVSQLCQEEEIIIDGKTYNVEKLRNSFVHGRWYITNNECIMMFGANPKNIRDYELDFIGKINVGSFEKWADNYILQYNCNKKLKR